MKQIKYILITILISVLLNGCGIFGGGAFIVN
jgi:hypothetical protein